VGELNTDGLDAVLNVFKNEIGTSKNAQQLLVLFENAYLKHNTLTEATHYLANALFAEYGLVIIDANDTSLKRLFIPQIEKELFEQVAFNKVNITNQAIEALDLKIQVNPREINLFYITKNVRERIVFENETYKVLNSNVSWSKSELQKELEAHPERFSPNVILRPLYQEVILPNLCYIGGGGELAYWFQLKANFEANNVVFPMLLLRNSALIKTQQQATKLEKLNISNKTLFLKRESFINKKVRDISNSNSAFKRSV